MYQILVILKVDFVGKHQCNNFSPKKKKKKRKRKEKKKKEKNEKRKKENKIK